MAANSRRKSRRKRFFHRTEPGAPPGVLVPDLQAAAPIVKVFGYEDFKSRLS